MGRQVTGGEKKKRSEVREGRGRKKNTCSFPIKIFKAALSLPFDCCAQLGFLCPLSRPLLGFDIKLPQPRETHPTPRRTLLCCNRCSPAEQPSQPGDFSFLPPSPNTQ